ncbi:penicillin-binding protein, partial [Bacillus toyonensis]
WFAGYTPQYTMAVWTGYTKDSKDDYISSKNTKIAQLIFKEMMSKFATDKSQFKMPNSVVQEGSELRIKGEKRDSSPNTTEPPNNGSSQGNTTPPNNGGSQGNTTPPNNGGSQGNTTPPNNGDGHGTPTQPSNDGNTGEAPANDG